MKLTEADLEDLVIAYNSAIKANLSGDDIFFFRGFPLTVRYAHYCIDKIQDDALFKTRHGGVRYK